MNLTLKREHTGKAGAFGELTGEDGERVAYTLERTYLGVGCVYAPKLSPGVYICKRGTHRLEGHAESLETFEITGVVGHTNILFHAGNYMADSSGCVLLGSGVFGIALTESRKAVKKFLEIQKGVDSFRLTVSNQQPEGV